MVPRGKALQVASGSVKGPSPIGKDQVLFFFLPLVASFDATLNARVHQPEFEIP